MNSNIIELLQNLQYGGLLTGICTFLIIGIFHPLVIKGEYYFGPKCKSWFLIAGLLFLLASVLVKGIFLSTILGVTSFSCFWSIREVNDQVKRVEKGWFPRNPKRSYPYPADQKPAVRK